MSADSGCTSECWEAVPCPACGNELPPRGRSAPLEMNVQACCDDAQVDPFINRRHLWSEHDDVRFYVDPEGWAAHLAECDRCVS